MTENEKQANIESIVNSSSYRLAYHDHEFISRPSLRPLRLELELLKPEMILEEHNVTSTIVTFGGTQIVEKEEAEQQLENAQQELAANPEDKVCQRGVTAG